MSFFCEICTKCLEKRVKTLFSHTFCGSSCKNLKKRCFFAFFANFVWSALKNVKKTMSSHTFYGTSCKKLKKRCLFAFFANFAQSVSKNVKKHCFLTIFMLHRAKSSKNMFFAFFVKFEQSASKNVKKNIVFSHFLWKVAHKLRKHHFFRILSEHCTLYSTKSSKKCLERREKNTVF